VIVQTKFYILKRLEI